MLLKLFYNCFSDQYNMYFAENPKEALEILENIPIPDLIIFDIIMPETDGLELYEIIKNNPEYKRIKFLCISSMAIIEEYKNKLEHLKLDYFDKPFETKELKKKINELLKK